MRFYTWYYVNLNLNASINFINKNRKKVLHAIAEGLDPQAFFFVLSDLKGDLNNFC